MKNNGCTFIKIIVTKLKISFFSFFLIPCILLISCQSDISFPVNLSIEGVPYERINAGLLSYEIQGSKMELMLETKKKRLPVKMMPVTRDLLKFKNDYKFEITKLYSPAGPSHYVKIFQKEKLKFIIGDNQSHTHKISGLYSVSPGERIQETEDRSRFWVNLIIKYKGETQEIKPGVLTKILINRQKSKFLLLGASVKKDRKTEKINQTESSGPDKKNKLPVAFKESESISDEAPFFVFDYIIFY